MASRQFTEQQTIPSIWRLLIFGGVTLMMAIVAIMTYMTEWKTMPDKDKWSMITLIIGPLATLTMFFLRLDIRFTSGTFEYKVHPFRRNYRVIPFSKIAEIELTRPKGLRSFQGIGTHRRLNRTEMNFGGKYLINMRFVNGRMFSATTNKPQELKSFLLDLTEGQPVVKIDL